MHPLSRSALFSLAAAAALSAACQRAQPHNSRPRAPSRPVAVATDAAVDPEVADIDRRVAAMEISARARNDDWLTLERIALLHMDRAQRTSDYDDFAHADEALTRAFARSPQGFGPLLTRAQFNYTLHRLDRVTPDLDAASRFAILSGSERMQIESLRANTAWHSGRYAEALAGFTQMLTNERSPGNLVALAQYRWKTNDYAGAEILLAEAARAATTTNDRSLRAWVCLVRGLMELDRGRWEQALLNYRDGLTLKPGYWLLEEHEAEAMALLGDRTSTIPKYLDLIRRTGNPEFMDAVSELYEAQNNHAEAQQWITRARAIYDRRLQRFPEAVAGHALEHFLAHDTARAVQIAEANVRARPGGEAQTLLARAYLRVGRVTDARTVIDRTLPTAWNTADLHAIASLVFAAQNDAARAATERAAAIAINPHIMEETTDWAPAPGAAH